MSRRLASRVLLVGWDAADWRTITPLLDAGEMPALQSLVERGVMGNLATLDPPFSPMLWTSIATGHTADRHGVLHFTQPNEEGTGARPVMGSTRKVKALWNILSQEGLRSNVVGWWPSHPAEPIRGAMVSDLYQRATAPVHEPWPLPPGTIHPPEHEEALAALRVHPAELTAGHLLPFIPRLGEIDQEADRRPVQLAKIIADAASVHAAATYLMEASSWDLTAVYLDAIDHAGHAFMRYHPPRMEGVAERDVALYGNVIREMYRFHDRMLGRLLDLAGDDATVILLSDHGFHSDHLRPVAIPAVPAGPAVEHRTFGVLCMAGPGLRRDERVHGAGLLNLAPTVLTLFGLPVGRDMAAPPLVDAFETLPEVDSIPSWDDVEGESGMHDEEARTDPWAEQHALQQLIDLGYIDEEAGTGPAAAAAAARDSGFNLGRVYLSTGRPHLAVPAFERAYAAGEEHRAHYGIWLAHAYAQARRLDEADALAQSLRDEFTHLGPSLALLLADLAIATGRPEEALEHLGTVTWERPEVLLRKATAFLALSRYEEADAVYQAVLRLDPDNARAFHGRAKVAIVHQRYEEAAHFALDAVARLYHYPEAHFHVGVAMTRLGWMDRAESAFRIALSQNPTLALAHRWLAKLYRGPLGKPEAAEAHDERYAELTE